MKLSVIIPVWNGRELLEACLTAMLAQTGPALEIVAVDNASADESADYIAAHFPSVLLIRNGRNLGFSGGCNLGLRVAQGEALVLVNQDVIVRPGWAQALVAAFSAQTRIGIVGGKGIYPDGRVQHAGGFVAWPQGYAHHYAYEAADTPELDLAGEVEFVTGAAFAIRRAVLEQVGELDEGFWPGYFEDIDYCLRARQEGWQVWYWPAARYVHHESQSSGAGARSESYQRGRLRFVLKHLSPNRWASEFCAAERAHWPAALADNQGRSLRRAYLEALTIAPRIVSERFPRERDAAERVSAALRGLYVDACAADGATALASAQRAAGYDSATVAWNFSDLTPEYVGVVEARARHKPNDALALREHHFTSTLPVVGPLLAWLRERWFHLSGRWALLFLMQQQEALNRKQAARLEALQQQMQALAEDNVWLAQLLTKRTE